MSGIDISTVPCWDRWRFTHDKLILRKNDYKSEIDIQLIVKNALWFSRKEVTFLDYKVLPKHEKLIWEHKVKYYLLFTKSVIFTSLTWGL